MIILGISAYYHDAAAALIEDGQIIAAAQEERFTRKKHDPSFPSQAIRYCLSEGNISLEEVDAIVFYDKPFLKFERLLETYYAFAPKGILSFISAIPVWIREKLFLKREIKTALSQIGPYEPKKLRFTEHHLSHAASAFFPSSFEEAAILTIDGVGEWATASICHGKGNELSILKELRFPHSLGLLYSAFTYYLGFKVNSGEYKLMGLAPYGNDSERTKRFTELIRDHLITIYEDGSIWLNQRYFNYATGLQMTHNRRWATLFGFERRASEATLEQVHCDLALAIQRVTEEVVLKMARTAKALTGASRLCLAGGVALNCVANGKLQEANIFDEIFIQPAAGDSGGALGAALATYHIAFKQPGKSLATTDLMQGSYLGPAFGDRDIQQVIRQNHAVAQAFEDFSALCTTVAQRISEGQIVGWVHGRMEYGPRALGNRSILADPRNADMQQKLNLKIKNRESFRPFAPAVLAEDEDRYFDMEGASPYMLLVKPVRKNLRNEKPEGYNDLDLPQKLYFARSSLPAVTHIDYSARVQTVHRETNPRFHQLITSFKKLTGCGVLVNTSFNVRGEPIVCTPSDAYRCFMQTEMDVLVIGKYLFMKGEQAMGDI